jgi:peptidoglycan/LPS O-acetylase OafA/YrhL
MTLNNFLQRDNNNFELLRLVAAGAVIIGHAGHISGDTSSRDLVLQWLQFDYSGSLAVKFFFLLSGLVVTNSWFSNPNIGRFVAARVARVFPALIVVLMLSAYVIGPAMTSLSPGAYLTSHDTLRYVVRNVMLNTTFILPGVFENAADRGVNGSIWTIPMECFCYLMLALVGSLCRGRNRFLFSLAVVLLAVAALSYPAGISKLRMPQESAPMFFYFAIGALLAVWKDKVVLNHFSVIGLALLSGVFRGTAAMPYLVCGTIFASAIWLATTPLVRRLRLPGDFSYGIYLSGWPIQQILHAAFPDMGAFGNWTSALLLASGFGAMSWYLVEKPCIGIGRRIGAGPSATADQSAAAKLV